MTTRAVFVTSKQPFGCREDGDITLSRVLIAALADVCELRVVALSDEPPVGSPPVELIEIAKPALAWPTLLRHSMRSRRSLIHTRFTPPALVQTLRRLDADVFVARRAYMAQAIVDAGRVPPRDRLCVVIDALESTVLTRRRSRFQWMLRAEAARTRRDELACLRAASKLAYLSDNEAEDLAGELPPAPRLDLVLAPARTPASLQEPLAVFVGDRTWEPNADAFRRLMRIWPRISAQTDGARLRVVGRPAPGEATIDDASIEVSGFVQDIEAVWSHAGVLLAPVRISGGVRVKVLDAARNGVPVIGTAEAIGSTRHFLPLTAHALEDEFIEASVRLLRDSEARLRAGRELYAASQAHHQSGALQRQLCDLIG